MHFLGTDSAATKVSPETTSFPIIMASLFYTVYSYILSATAGNTRRRLSHLEAILNTAFNCYLIQPKNLTHILFKYYYNKKYQ